MSGVLNREKNQQALQARQNPVLTHRLSPSAFSVVCQ
jgi:hypothetical protein